MYPQQYPSFNNYQQPFNFQNANGLNSNAGQQLIRVNGLDSAKAYPTQPNSTVALFDANEDIMYIKSTDASNYPSIRRFRFVEEIENHTTESQYVTKEEFELFKEQLLNEQQSIRANKSKPKSNSSGYQSSNAVQANTK